MLRWPCVPLLVLVLAGCGVSAHPRSSRGAAPDRPLTRTAMSLGMVQGASREQVSVAYLGPDLAIAVDVATGRLELSGLALGFRDDRPWDGQRADQPLMSGVVGIEDPLDHHRLFRYQGGIPGMLPAAAGAVALAAPPAAGALAVWSAPREVLRAGRLVALVFADGQRVGIASDSSGRVTGVSWSTAHNARLRTTIRYAGSLTMITDPFGVSRTYQHLAGGGAFEIVPAAWRTGPGYRHYVYPVLDDARETGWIQHRTIEQRPVVRQLLDDLPAAAGAAFGGASYDSPANGGYIDIGLASLAPAHRVDSTMRELGLLDVSAIMPTLDSAAELRRAADSLRAPLDPIARACHIVWGENVDVIDVTVADTITPTEVAVLDRALQSLPAWAVIQRAGSSLCATARVSLRGTRQQSHTSAAVAATAAAGADHRTPHAAGDAQVRISLPRSALEAGQAVPVTILNAGPVPILRGICLILARRVDGRWATITRTHGVNVSCEAAGIPQAARSRATLTLPLFDDLVPGAYRVTLLYRPMSSGTVGRLGGRDERSTSAQITVLAFSPGPMPQLPEARILELAQTAAAQAGDPDPSLIQHSEGTRFEANLVAAGDLVFEWNWSYLIAEKGHFVYKDATGPPGAKPPTGSVITLIVDGSTGHGTDSGISNRYPDLPALGSVTTDLPSGGALGSVRTRG